MEEIHLAIIVGIFVGLVCIPLKEALKERFLSGPYKQAIFSISLSIFSLFVLFSLFSYLLYTQSGYEGIVFREIGRNGYANGGLSTLVTKFMVCLSALSFLLYSGFKDDGIGIKENFKKLLSPTSKTGYIVLTVIIFSLLFIGMESFARRFYVKEMVAYYNQLVVIADHSEIYKNGEVRIFADAQLAQIESKNEFYILEKFLLDEIARSNQSPPKRLRQKVGILDKILIEVFPRPNFDEQVFRKGLKTLNDKFTIRSN